MSRGVVTGLSVYHLKIPMRQRVEHAASSRNLADPIVVKIGLDDQCVGYGETLPRPYVTDEDATSVDQTIQTVLQPLLRQISPRTFSDALSIIESLPVVDSNGKTILAARAAVEMALLDAFSQFFQRPIAGELVNWLELIGFGDRGSIDSIRCSGVLASMDSEVLAKSLFKMRCYGLRHFKLKVGFENDRDRLEVVLRSLRSSLSRGRATLRLDANGGWTFDQAVQHLNQWSDHGISYVEQPLAKGQEDRLPDLKSRTGWKLIHDESLLTLQDAQRLCQFRVADCFNIRLSKCGGLIPSLKLAKFCRQNGIEIILGCMVGQTSILSAAERRFLEIVPGIRWAETNFGKHLLKEDLTQPSLQFRYGGKLKMLNEFGWGVTPDQNRLITLNH